MNVFDQNLEALIKDLPIVISDNILTIMNDAKALIQQRVQERGVDADGHITPEYSDSYIAVRKRKGRQTTYMDLTFTEDMWQSIGFTDKKVAGEETTITLAGRDEFAQNKINWNSEKKFEVLKLSKEEEETLQGFFDENFTKTILEYLNRGIE